MKHKSSRHQARFATIQHFAQILHKLDTQDISLLTDSLPSNTDIPFAQTLINTIIKKLEFVKQFIRQILTAKPFTDFDIITQSIFICAITEALFIKTPIPVLIKEYTTLTKRLTLESEYKIVHALLDQIGKYQQLPTTFFAA